MVPSPIIPPDDPGDHGQSESGTTDVVVTNEVEIKNDVGNPIPVSSTQLPAALNGGGNLKTSIEQPVPGVGFDTDAEAVGDGNVIQILKRIRTLVGNLITNTDGVERKFDGDDISGAGTITIPDGVLSFAVTVSAVGSGVTINGPDTTSGAVTLFTGQSVMHSGDGKKDTINGPITITTTAGSIVNATWIKA